MNTRRKFLAMLGLGAVAAPIAMKAMGESDASSITDGSHTHTITPNDGSHTHTISYSRSEMRDLIEAQREINRRYSEYLRGAQWTPEQVEQFARFHPSS